LRRTSIHLDAVCVNGKTVKKKADAALRLVPPSLSNDKTIGDLGRLRQPVMGTV